MSQRGFVIDLTRFTISPCTYDPRRIDDLFVRVNGKDLIPAAYVFPEASKDKLIELVQELERLKKSYDDEVARIYYKELPKIRG